MFQLLRDPKFEFMKNARLFLAVSAVLTLAAVGVLFVRGLRKGIEFTGGTEVQIKYATEADISAIRSELKNAGLAAQVTTIGAPEEHEIYIRLAEGSGGEERGDVISAVIATLHPGHPGHDGERQLDLNVADQSMIAGELEQVPGVTGNAAAELAAAISAKRKDIAIFLSFDDLAELPGMNPEILAFLEDNAYLGDLALRSQSYIGPAVGEELMNKTKLAIVFSLLMMLVYIWFRFQLQWGFAAVAALTHDTLITLGLFSLMNKEMSLPVVAAFLTLVGYSVNDTVVVFDRIRENVRNRAGRSFEETINLSINQTLARTIITSGLTWIVVVALYVYGGPALNAFAFVLSAGVIVGTYSSIYIASPILLLFGKAVKGEASSPAPPAAARRVKKVRTS